MKYDVKQFSLEEKLHLLTGKDMWQLTNANGKLPTVWLTDGPHGLRMSNPKNTAETLTATAFPTLSVLANTWDTELAYLQGNSIADDCVENNASVLLAPGVNIKRTPLCGRNFEYFSEDPYLSGTLAKAYIEGVQEKGIGTSLKHFCANNREYERLYQTSEIDERTMREIYLPAFEIALEAQPWTVMCAYNLVNGVWASENKWLLNDILRGEFGYDGMIVSDWGAVHHSARAVKASLDLRMPYCDEAYQELKTAYDEGWLSDEEIDERVKKILEFVEKTENDKKKVTTTKEQRHENAVKIAKAGAVLLKNEDGILPLKGGNILVAGYAANNPYLGGGGSSGVQTTYQSKPMVEELSLRLGEKATISFSSARCAWGNLIEKSRYLYQDSYEKDAVIVFVGTSNENECEGYDRTTLKLSQAQEDLILGVAKVNPNVIVVVEAGSAVDMSAWIDKVKAVVFLGFAGEGMQEAIADLLVGNACPCGKLSETFPLCLEDTPTGEYRGDGFVDVYSEGIYVGYRYYDKYKKNVLFPFGHGLSYAKFEYSDLKIEKLGETDYEVSYTVQNVSNVDGAEISQIYVKDVFAMVSRPEKELKGFAKTFLKAGECKRISVKLDYRSFAYYSIPLKKWYVENGTFEILVGASSKDLRLAGKVEISLPENEQASH